MKFNLIISILSLSLFTHESIAQKPVFTKAQVHSVKVYRNAAELSNTVQFSIPKGTTEVVIGNISAGILEKTIQYRLNSNNISILSTQFTLDYIREFEIDETNPVIKKAADSVRIVEDLIVKNKIELDANVKAIELLDKNQTVLVGNTQTTVNQLNELTTYYTNKRIELNQKVENLKKESIVLNKQLARLKSSLQVKEQKEVAEYAAGNLVLKLMSASPATVQMDLSYLIQEAGWTPYYEIRGENITKPLDVVFKGMVRQNSGLDWKSVKLELINGLSNRSNNAPQLSTWFLSPYQEAVPAPKYNRQAMKSMDISSSNIQNEVVMDYEPVEFTINSNQLNVSYEVNVPYDIKTNGQDHLISLFTQQIPAKYQYFTAPSLSQEAYLMAKVQDFSQYGMLNANAAIVFENMYIGETYINTNQTSNELDITLGNDKRISVKKTLISDKSGEKLLSTNKEKTITYDLEIKNNKKEKIEIEIKDRFPISNNEQVKIELLEVSKAEVDKEKGFLTWTIGIAPGSTQKIRVSYKVKYPKDMIINI